MRRRSSSSATRRTATASSAPSTAPCPTGWTSSVTRCSWTATEVPTRHVVHVRFKPLAASMGPMLKEESFHLGTGSNGLRRIITAGVVPLDMLQRYINKWVATAHDLFGVDESSSAEWAYVWGIKGRWDERKKQEQGVPLDRDHLNEEARGHYHQEIVDAVKALCGYLPEGAAELLRAHENFNREIGAFAKGRYTVEGTPFEGDDAAWEAYLRSVLHSEDEAALPAIFEQQWISEKPLSARQRATGIGASA